MSEAKPLSIAIVGAGPAGFYAADALLRKSRSCRIDIIDRLPTPYGLVRAGVAPDHQSTKNVIRIYDRILQDPAVRLVGNITLGRDVSYDQLKALYDVLILSFGAQVPRRLGIAGESLGGVVDATGFVDWYNAVPGAPDLCRAVQVEAAVVVGVGNVALDIARLLAKTKAETAASDIDPDAGAALQRSPIADIYVVGRRGPLQAAFTAPELRELGKLERGVPVVDAAALPDDASSVAEEDRRKREKNLSILKGYGEIGEDPRPVKIHLMFGASPLEILGADRVSGVRFARNRIESGRAVPTGETFEVAAQLVVSAIGYRSANGAGHPPLDAARGVVKNQDGRVEPGVYVVGWARRGPSGVIGTNRNDAREVVDLILADDLAVAKPGGAGLDALLAEGGAEPTTYEDWKRIDAAEVAAGAADRPRVKLTSIAAMLKVARGAEAPE